MSGLALPLDRLPQVAVQTRVSDTLVAAGTTFPFTATMNVTFPEPGRLRIAATGLAATLVVQITGELNGVGDTESVTLLAAGSGYALSAKQWTKITEVKVTASQAGSCAVAARTLGNQPMALTQTIATALPIRLRMSRMLGSDIEGAGRQTVERFVGYVSPTATVQTQDRLLVDGVTYEVEHAVPVYGRTAVHHHELRLRRLRA